jgi:hypothetical protein
MTLKLTPTDVVILVMAFIFLADAFQRQDRERTGGGKSIIVGR